MGRWKTIAILVTVVMVSSIILGYVFDTWNNKISITQTPLGLGYYRGIEPGVEPTIAASTHGDKTLTRGVGGKAAESLQKHLTVYTDQERLVSYEASISLLSPINEVENSVDKILSIIDRYNGYVSSMNVGGKTAYLVARIPQNNLFSFLEDVSELGEVVSRSISGIDVTEKVIDLEARIRNAETIEVRLLELLNIAKNVDEILEVMKELSRIREEIEIMKAQLRNLDKSIAYSTVIIEISEKELRREYVKILFKVVDSRNLPVPNTYIYVKDGIDNTYVTDEFGEAVGSFEKNVNLTLIAVFYRSDGEILKASVSDVADSNKTITIRFEKSFEPPLINLEKLPIIASVFVNYLITGLTITIVFVIPMLFLVLLLLAVGRRIYVKIRP